jgi:hypothetical protein
MMMIPSIVRRSTMTFLTANPVLLEPMKKMASAFRHLQASMLQAKVTPSLLYYAALREQQLAVVHMIV